MKLTLRLICFLISISCSGQKKNDQIILDKTGNFDIEKEGEVFNPMFGDPVHNDTIRASLTINNFPQRKITFSKSHLKNGELEILLYCTNSAYDYRYKIKIVRNQFSIEYKYSTSGQELIKRITLVESHLRLNDLNFVKGKILRGYTEFVGKCEGEGCYGEKSITIKGNFSTLISD